MNDVITLHNNEIYSFIIYDVCFIYMILNTLRLHKLEVWTLPCSALYCSMSLVENNNTNILAPYSNFNETQLLRI